jgi:hypothetical protein
LNLNPDSAPIFRSANAHRARSHESLLTNTTSGLSRIPPRHCALHNVDFARAKSPEYQAEFPLHNCAKQPDAFLVISDWQSLAGSASFPADNLPPRPTCFAYLKLIFS